jgi:hypothetical protein
VTNVVTYDQPTTSAVAKNWDMLIERRVNFAKDDPTHRGHASMSAEDPWADLVVSGNLVEHQLVLPNHCGGECRRATIISMRHRTPQQQNAA